MLGRWWTVAAMKDFLLKHADLESEGADVLMAFVFATWFVDCFLVAPVLYLHGPRVKSAM
jgi:hypothetical protein